MIRDPEDDRHERLFAKTTARIVDEILRLPPPERAAAFAETRLNWQRETGDDLPPREINRIVKSFAETPPPPSPPPPSPPQLSQPAPQSPSLPAPVTAEQQAPSSTKDAIGVGLIAGPIVAFLWCGWWLAWYATWYDGVAVEYLRTLSVWVLHWATWTLISAISALLATTAALIYQAEIGVRGWRRKAAIGALLLAGWGVWQSWALSNVLGPAVRLAWDLVPVGGSSSASRAPQRAVAVADAVPGQKRDLQYCVVVRAHWGGSRDSERLYTAWSPCMWLFGR